MPGISWCNSGVTFNPFLADKPTNEKIDSSAQSTSSFNSATLPFTFPFLGTTETQFVFLWERSAKNETIKVKTNTLQRSHPVLFQLCRFWPVAPMLREMRLSGRLVAL